MARDWFLDASEKGHTTAQYELRGITNTGVPVKATEQGDVDAQDEVGLLFEYLSRG